MASWAKCLQIPGMIAPLLGARDNMMDLKALPDVSAASPVMDYVMHLSSRPSEVLSAILANETVPA
jgi:hypothetical protein